MGQERRSNRIRNPLAYCERGRFVNDFAVKSTFQPL